MKKFTLLTIKENWKFEEDCLFLYRFSLLRMPATAKSSISLNLCNVRGAFLDREKHDLVDSCPVKNYLESKD